MTKLKSYEVSSLLHRWFPDYYDDIANPISLTQIKRKIKKKKYISLNEMAADMNLMFENAKEYNADESKIFEVKFHLLKCKFSVL